MPIFSAILAWIVVGSVLNKVNSIERDARMTDEEKKKRYGSSDYGWVGCMLRDEKWCQNNLNGNGTLFKKTLEASAAVEKAKKENRGS